MYDSDCCRSMMWMPLRSVRMKRLTFGFHRRVWCPKCTPLSSSWRMVTTAMVVSLFWRSRAVEVVSPIGDRQSWYPAHAHLLIRTGPEGVMPRRESLWARVVTPKSRCDLKCTGSAIAHCSCTPPSSCGFSTNGGFPEPRILGEGSPWKHVDPEHPKP